MAVPLRGRRIKGSGGRHTDDRREGLFTMTAMVTQRPSFQSVDDSKPRGIRTATTIYRALTRFQILCEELLMLCNHLAFLPQLKGRNPLMNPIVRMRKLRLRGAQALAWGNP